MHIYYLRKINFGREIWIQVLVILLQLYVNEAEIEKLSGKTLESKDKIELSELIWTHCVYTRRWDKP